MSISQDYKPHPLSHLSYALQHFIVDGILELHPSVERVGLVILDQLREAVKSRRANHVLVVIHLDTTVTNPALRSTGGKIKKN